jgi:hypothetical protein
MAMATVMAGQFKRSQFLLNYLGLARKAEVDPRGTATSHREGIAQILWGIAWSSRIIY